MVHVRHLTPADYRRVPWKNGQGATLEILREPADPTVDFVWRLSVADVKSDGPFSAFPGYERVLVVVEGEGIVLRHNQDEQSVPLAWLQPYRFLGAWATECELIEGPIRDFNLIVRPGQGASVDALALDREECRPLRGRSHVLYCHEGECEVAACGGRWRLGPGETLLLQDGADPGCVLRPADAAVVLLVTLR